MNFMFFFSENSAIFVQRQKLSACKLNLFLTIAIISIKQTIS